MYEEYKHIEKERFKQLFRDLVEYVIHKKSTFYDRVEEHTDHYIVTEEDRGGNHYVHLVPKVVYHKFRGFQINSPNKEPPQYILCGRKGPINIKVSCFGVDVKDVIKEYQT